MTERGRVRATRTLPWHRGTTASLQGAYPFLSAPGLAARLSGRGLLIGRDWHGAAFSFDPFTLYAAGMLTNPNMLVVGQVGSGKSALVKTLLWRAIAFGHAAWIADPKGEYSDLAAAADAPVMRLGPGEPARLNPLDTADDDVRAARHTLRGRAGRPAVERHPAAAGRRLGCDRPRSAADSGGARRGRAGTRHRAPDRGRRTPGPSRAGRSSPGSER